MKAVDKNIISPKNALKPLMKWGDEMTNYN